MMTGGEQSEKGPLEGVRVLSLAEQLPGPYATMLLADLGADVVLVERPQGGDPGRAFPDFFRALARNKRSVCLDLKSAEGKNGLKRLVANSDVMLEGFRPGRMAALGLGYEELAAINPQLIHVSISGFGQDGPYRDRTAHDLSYQAVSGHLFEAVGCANAAVPHIPYGDLASAMFAAFAITTALFARERTGLGTAIDVSVADALVSWLTPYLGPVMNGAPMLRITDEPGYGIFTCADGRQLTLSIAHEDHFWRALCGIVGLQRLQDLRSPERIARSGELRSTIAEVIGGHARAHWEPLFDEHAIPWSPMSTLPDVLADPHFAARMMFSSIVGGEGIAERHVLQPLHFSGYATKLRRPAPRLGEHNSELL